MTDDAAREPSDAIDPEELIPDRPRTGATVIRRRAGRLSLETFAPIITQILGIYKGDATKLCAQESPIILDNAEAEKADALAEALRANGEDCFVIPAADVVPLPRKHPVHSARLTQEQVTLLDSTGQPHDCPWNKAIILAMGHVAVHATTKKATYNSPFTKKLSGGAMLFGTTGAIADIALSGADNVKTVTSSSMHTMVDIVFLGPLRRFGIDAREFDYSILGDQQQQGSDANIRLFVRWLLYQMPGIRSNFDTDHLLKTGEAQLPRYSPHGFNETVHWLINLVKHDRPAAP